MLLLLFLCEDIFMIISGWALSHVVSSVNPLCYYLIISNFVIVGIFQQLDSFILVVQDEFLSFFHSCESTRNKHTV